MEKSLGDLLREARDAMGLSLREVERRTGGKLKSGYLSQLERDRIARPTPETLSKVADLYGLDYGFLLEKAGHRIPEASSPRSGLIAGMPIRALEELDEEDKKAVREYVSFLQQRRSRSR